MQKLYYRWWFVSLYNVCWSGAVFFFNILQSVDSFYLIEQQIFFFKLGFVSQIGSLIVQIIEIVLVLCLDEGLLLGCKKMICRNFSRKSFHGLS